MHALVVEGVIGLAEAVLENLLSIERVGRRDAAGRVDAQTVVIADRMVDLHAQVLLRLGVKIEEAGGALAAHAERIEDVVSALDRKIPLDRPRLLEALVA